jgi:hypothetical protein
MPLPGHYRKQRIARTERRDRKGQESLRQADFRRGRTGDWGLSEDLARKALNRNKARLLSK